VRKGREGTGEAFIWITASGLAIEWPIGTSGTGSIVGYFDIRGV
jgi:hypothetical protein